MAERFYFDLDIITPLAIGAGDEKDWINGLDFVVKEGKAYILDLNKAIETGVDIDRLTACFLQRDSKGVMQLLGNNLERVSKRILSCPNVGTNSDIKSFIRNQLTDKPVVPGSSLKGAIRSILFTHLRKHGEERNDAVFGKLKGGEDFMRFIQFSDIELSKTKLFNTKIFNLQNLDGEWVGGWKHGARHTDEDFKPNGFNTIYECLYNDEDNLGYGNVTFKQKLFDMFDAQTEGNMPYRDGKKQLMGGGITNLFKIINAHTRAYLQKEKKFFKEFQADRSDEIIECIDSLLDTLAEINDNSSCLLKMSAGSGYHSITGDWKYDDYTDTGEWENGRNAGKMKYKSRKIVQENGYLSLMGFVMLTSITKDEYENGIA